MPPSRQIPLPFPEASLSFDEMAITSANRAICAAIRNPDRWPYHAFCLIGPAGSGITSLARAWAAERGVRYFDADEITKLDLPEIEALAETDIVIDNVDRLKDAETLLLLLSSVQRHNKHVLLTGHTAPTQWPFRSPDLMSRLQAAPLAQLPPPDEELMRARLSRAFSRSMLAPPKTVEDYLVTRLGLDYSQIEEVAERLAGASGDRPLTVPLAREILGEQQG